MKAKQTPLQYYLSTQTSSTKGDTKMNNLKMNTFKSLSKINSNSVYIEQIKALCFFTFAFLLFTPDVFGVADTTDVGFNTSATNLMTLINGRLVPIILIAGCLASAALAFMKSTPTPFVIAILTTISFGFAKVWINTTYAICV